MKEIGRIRIFCLRIQILGSWFNILEFSAVVSQRKQIQVPDPQVTVASQFGAVFRIQSTAANVQQSAHKGLEGPTCPGSGLPLCRVRFLLLYKHPGIF